MLLEKYSEIINGIDPDRIYVENVRRILKLPRFSARVICEMAVSEKLFRKRIGVACPNCGRIIEHYAEGEMIPEKMICEVCEINEEKNFLFNSLELETIQFYQLVK